MIYGYIRVSTDKQTSENQRFEVRNFCEREHLLIDGWIDETISGTKSYSKRKLGALLKHVKAGDTIICSELSRLGRNLFMIMEILSLCMQKGVKVWTIKDNYRLGDDIQSKVLAFAFGLSAEIERNLISQRTKEALARLKAEGVNLGRPKGRRNDPDKYKLSGKEGLIQESIAQGVSLRKIAKLLNVDRNTLDRFIKLKNIKKHDNGTIKYAHHETRGEVEPSAEAQASLSQGTEEAGGEGGKEGMEDDQGGGGVNL